MSSLLEILDDPNYVSANEPTKRAIFDKYSALDKNYTNANDATKEAIRQKFGVQDAEPETSTGKAVLHSLVKSALPTAAGFVGGGFGAIGGGGIGSIPLAVAGALGASTATSMAQEKLLKQFPEAAKAMGLDEETAALEEKEHPLATQIAGFAPSVIGMRPSGALLKSAKGLSEDAAKALKSEKIAAAVNASIGSGIGAGIEAGSQAIGEEPMDYSRIATQAALGLLGQKETKIGRKLSSIGEKAGSETKRAAFEALRRPKSPEEVAQKSTEVSQKDTEIAPPIETELPSKMESQDRQFMMDDLEGKKPVKIEPEKLIEPTKEAEQVEPIPEPVPEPIPEKIPEPTPENIPENILKSSLDDTQIVEQNRTRDLPASIQQMNKIASNPIYEFVAVDNKMGSGAPIITGPVKIPEAQLGKKSVAIGEDGTKIPVQYAVVNAKDVLPSNNVNGAPNPQYSPEYTGLRSVVGNGRTAGIIASHERGTANEYKSKLLIDESHGISKEAIQSVENPMLVRVASEKSIPKNIGDISNISQTLNLSTVEQAKNDSHRIDLDGIKFDENGEISQESKRGFIQAMPESEQANLIDAKGNPTKQSVDRLKSAIFHKAYENDELTNLAHQAEDPEARNIVNALSQAAPEMAQLHDAAGYDVRPIITQAAEMAVNARRNGLSLSDLSKQQDMTAHPLTQNILELFANNPRSAKKIAEGLKSVAKGVREEVNAPAEDMFGVRPKRSLEDIVKEGLTKKEESDLFENISTVEPNKQQKENNKNVEKQFENGKIVYENKNLSLVRVLGENGDPLYFPVKEGRFLRADIQELEDKQPKSLSGFTKEEKDELLSVRKKLEDEDLKKFQDNPFVKFTKENEYSENFPNRIKPIIENWKKLLGIKQNIYFTTLEDAIKNKDNFHGPERRIAYSLVTKNEGGFTTLIGNGNRVIAFKKSTSLTKMLETIAHELGHTHESESFIKAPPEVQKLLKEEHLKWANSINRNTLAKDVIESLRSKTSAQTTKVDNTLLAKDMKKIDSYWRSFSEWYADQVARWSVSSEKPVSVVEKFFSKLGNALRKFYQTLKGSKYLPNETFKQYLDSQAVKLDLIPESAVKNEPQQGLLFSKTSVESEKQAKNIYNEPVDPTWNTPEISKITGITRLFQDRHVDMKLVVNAIKKEMKDLNERWNPYLKESLYHSKTANSISEFERAELTPLVKDMIKLNVDNKDLHDYMHNRHAEEFNNQMNKINPDIEDAQGNIHEYALKDKASGIHTNEARKYLSELDADKKAKLEELAKKVDDMVKGTQKILVESGQETQETIDRWNSTYENYAPLFRKMAGIDTPSTLSSKGVGVRGAFSKRAMGSEKEVQDILSSIIGQREKALINAEKIKVNNAVYGLSIKAPNPDFWMAVNPDAIKNPELLARELDALGIDGKEIVGLMQEKTSRVIRTNPKTGLEEVNHVINSLDRYKDNVLPIRINGEDRFVFFNKENPVAANMVKALRNMDVDQLQTVDAIAAKMTRWFSAVNTQYNPVFGFVNFLRDYQGAMVNLTSTPIAGKQAEVSSGVFPAMKGIFKSIRALREGGEYPTDEWSQSYKEFRELGGQTLFRDSLVRKAEQSKIVDEKLKQMKAGPAKKAFVSAANMLSDFNDTIENAIRLSAYKTASKTMSKESAALLAKELTVNFDRKGALGSKINAWYAFFNASAQGTARLMETMKGPKGKLIFGGGVGIGVMQAVMMAAAGFDDNDPPEFVKERNFIIPLPDGKYSAIPYPIGLHWFPNTGRLATEFVLNGGKKAGEKASNFFGMTADAFNPIGSSGLSMQTVLPTVLDPLAALEANKDSFGRPIYKADRATNPTPGYLRSREGASEINKMLSKFLNYASGGTEFKKGVVSPTADALDYLTGQVTGGTGREIMKVGELAKSVSTGEELPSYRVPLAGRFYGDTESKAADSQRFYENVTRMAEHENEIKGRRKAGYQGQTVAEYIRENPESRLWQQANNVENQISQLNKKKKNLQERGADKDKILMIDNQKQMAMKRFNDRIKALEE